MAIYMGAGPSVMYANHAFAALQQFEAATRLHQPRLSETYLVRRRTSTRSI